jgi:hypothetical protein
MLRTAFLGLLLGTLGAARAQSIDPFDMAISNILLLQDKKVQADMKVTPDQRLKLNEHAENAQKKTKAMADQLLKEGKKPEMARNDPRVQRHFQGLKKSIMEVLTPAQRRRLREISLQSAGLAAVLEPRVAQRIGMSEAQRKQIETTYRNGQQRAFNIQRDAAQASIKEFQNRKPKSENERKEMEQAARARLEASQKRVRPQVAAIEADVMKKMNAAIKPEQLAKLKQLQGAPFGRPRTSFDPGN